MISMLLVILKFRGPSLSVGPFLMGLSGSNWNHSDQIPAAFRVFDLLLTRLSQFRPSFPDCPQHLNLHNKLCGIANIMMEYLIVCSVILMAPFNTGRMTNVINRLVLFIK